MPAEKQLDVYRDWLGITEAKRPLNHYQLLRLKQFEDDTGKIRDNYRKMNAHVRKYSSGEFGPKSQALLNELAKAMLCLTDARRKSEYDITLGRKEAAPGVRRTFEDLLLVRGVIDPNQLKKARTLADTVGWELRDALIQQKLPPETIIPVYAESVGLPYLELGDISLDESLLPKIPAVLARQHSCVPVMVDDNQALIASPHPLLPEVEEELRLRLGMSVRTVLCTPTAMNDAISKHYPKEAAVAEMQGKSAAPPKPGQTNSSGAGGAKVVPLTADELAKRKKDRLMVGVVAFNVAMMVMMVGQTLFMTRSFTDNLKLSIPVAVVVAAISYVVALKKI
jgi:hypothetical protein